MFSAIRVRFAKYVKKYIMKSLYICNKDLHHFLCGSFRIYLILNPQHIAGWNDSAFSDYK